MNIKWIPFLFALGLLAAATTAAGWGQDAPSPAGDRESKQQEADRLVAVLKSDAPLSEKALACKRLAVIGSGQAVPTLAALLADERLAHYARYSLEQIPDSSAEVALREALSRLKGQLLIGVINSIGSRRDAQALGSLRELLADSDPNVVAAAAAAVARVGGGEAAGILQQALASTAAANRPEIADACLACAQQLWSAEKRDEATTMYDTVRSADVPKHIRLAATRGAILARRSAGLALLVEQLQAEDEDFFRLALGSSHQLPGAEVTRALLSTLEDLPPRRRALVILALGDRGDAAALPLVLLAATDGPSQLRIAAIRSLAQIGDVSAAPLLLKAIVEPDDQVAEAAKHSLVAIPDPKVDAAIMVALEDSQGRTRHVLIDVVADRRIRSAVGQLVEAADDPDPQIRLAAVRALGETAGPEHLPELISRATSSGTTEQQEASRNALKAASVRMPDPEACVQTLLARMSDAPLQAKSFLLEVVGTVGGPAALQAMSASAKDPNPDIQDTATRILGEWMSPDAAVELLKLAKTLDNNRYKIRTLRGYIRIIRQLGLPTEQRLAMCREAMNVAQRADEKKLVLAVLGRIPSAEALSQVTPYLRDPALRQDAGKAAVSIAEKTVQDHPGAVAEAMQQVLQSNVNRGLKQRAQAVLEKAGGA